MGTYILEWFTGIGHAHGHFFADTLQLERLEFFLGKEDLIGRVSHKGSSQRTPLQDYQSVAMGTRIDAGSLVIECFADHPADLFMSDPSFLCKGKVRCQ